MWTEKFKSLIAVSDDKKNAEGKGQKSYSSKVLYSDGSAVLRLWQWSLDAEFKDPQPNIGWWAELLKISTGGITKG